MRPRITAWLLATLSLCSLGTGRAALAQDAADDTDVRTSGRTATLLQAPRAAGAASDPGRPGPLSVTSAEYNFGFTALQLPGFPGPVELAAVVHHPAALQANTKYPVLIFLHGRHVTATDGRDAFMVWPPGPGQAAIPSHRGYDYLGRHMASYGYIVVSISANGINARDNMTPDAGMTARARLIQTHLDLWNLYNTQGANPFGTRFVGKVDLTRVGVMGHSRGGEGAVFNYLLNAGQRVRYGIRAVLPLAPTNFHRVVINNVPVGVLLPYCDGDVNDLQGVAYFDDARYNLRGDAAPKHSFVVMGANHNFYNSVWSPSSRIPASTDDWFENVRGAAADPVFGSFAGSRKLSEAQQRAGGLALMAAFFRAHVAGRAEFMPLLRGDAPTPPSAASNQVYVSYHAPDSAASRRDINRFLTSANLSANTLGGRVLTAGLSQYLLAGGASPQPRHVLSYPRPDDATPQEPHTTVHQLAKQRRGLSQLVVSWNTASSGCLSEIPAAFRDARRYNVLQFRAGVNFADGRNREALKDFTVTLIDASGRTVSAAVSAHSRALYFPPGQVFPLPKILLHTIRIPLAAFRGVDLGNLRGVQFTFNRQSQGAVVLTDLAFADPSERVVGGKLSAPNAVNFGSVKRRKKRNRVLTIANTSPTEEMEVEILGPKGVFTLLSDGKPVTSLRGPIPPNTRATLTIRFRPTRRGKASGAITIRTTDPAKRTHSVRLRGKGR